MYGSDESVDSAHRELDETALAVARINAEAARMEEQSTSTNSGGDVYAYDEYDDNDTDDVDDYDAFVSDQQDHDDTNDADVDVTKRHRRRGVQRAERGESVFGVGGASAPIFSLDATQFTSTEISAQFDVDGHRSRASSDNAGTQPSTNAASTVSTARDADADVIAQHIAAMDAAHGGDARPVRANRRFEERLHRLRSSDQ